MTAVGGRRRPTRPRRRRPYDIYRPQPGDGRGGAAPTDGRSGDGPAAIGYSAARRLQVNRHLNSTRLQGGFLPASLE